MAKHRHAVVRDLNSLGYHGDAPIDLGDLVSIVLASPPGSAVRYAVEEGWSLTDQLLAIGVEQDAQLVSLSARYTRPGVVAQEPYDPGPFGSDGSTNFAALTVQEYLDRRGRDMARGEELAASETKTIK